MKRSKTLAKMIVLLSLIVAAAAPLNCAKAPAPKEKGKNAESKKTVVKKTDAPAPGEPSVLEIGMRAPEIGAKDADGKPVRLADFKGRVVVLTFWDVTCDACKKQMKALETELAKKKEDAVMLAVAQYVNDAKNKDAAESLKKSGVKATALFDASNETGAAYQITGVPYFAVIDKAGRLQGAGVFDVSAKMNTMNFIQVVLALAGGGKVPRCEFAETAVPDQYTKLVGKDAPNFRLNDLNGNDESPLYYKQFSNLLLVFWSPMCPHCRRELPRLESFYRKKGKEMNLKIIGIVSTPEKDDQNFEQMAVMTKQVALQDKLTFPVVLDIGSKLHTPYNVEGVPTLIYIGASGKIEHAWRGESLFTGENIECAVEKPGKGR